MIVESKKIDEMSPREMRIALKMQRAFLRGIAESCDNFAESSRSDITKAQYAAIAEEARAHADKYF